MNVFEIDVILDEYQTNVLFSSLCARFEIDVILDEYQTEYLQGQPGAPFEIDVILDEYQTWRNRNIRRIKV